MNMGNIGSGGVQPGTNGIREVVLATEHNDIALNAISTSYGPGLA